MPISTSYTTLESLLLFQSLITHGTDQHAFDEISRKLQDNALVKHEPTYDQERLSAKALKELYSQLVREELRCEDEQDGLRDGTQYPSRKRKHASPRSPSLKDVEASKGNLPLLSEKLYARFKEHTISAIREDEQRILTLQQELRAIEKEGFHHIQPEQKVKEYPDGVSRSPCNTVVRPATNGISVAVNNPPPQETRPLLAPPTGLPIGLQLNYPPPSIARASPNVSPRAKAKTAGPPQVNHSNIQQRGIIPSPKQAQSKLLAKPSAPPAAALRNDQQLKPAGPASSLTPTMSHTSHNWKWEPPYQAGTPLQPNPYQMGHSQPLPSPQFSPHTLAPPRGGVSWTPSQRPSPQNYAHVPSHSDRSNQPLLPPPTPSGIPNQTSKQALDALAEVAGQQYRAPLDSPSGQRNQPSLPFAPHPLQQRPPSPSGSTASPLWNQNQYYTQPYMGLPPGAYSSQSVLHKPDYPTADFHVPENRHYNSPYNASQARPVSPYRSSKHITISPTPVTPISKPGVRFTGTGTKWTPIPTNSTPNAHVNPPLIEPLSPVDRSASLPTVSEKPTKPLDQVVDAFDTTKQAPPLNTQLKRDGGVASSIAAESPCSEFVASQSDAVCTNESPMDIDVPTNPLVKEEVISPLADKLDENLADEDPSPRLRDGPRMSNKRKRRTSVEKRHSSGPPTHVLWTRAFPKIASSALGSISGHRYASTFANPVKERDAPGYKDWIHRPQDLKSIRSAITAGNKAGAVAATALGLDNGQTSIMLPVSEELVPPKSIINNDQLERELMRMFANAIMFNADPNGTLGDSFQKGSTIDSKAKEGHKSDANTVVKDTIAMFKDTEAVIGALRSAERRSEEIASQQKDAFASTPAVEEDDIDELAMDGEAMSSVAKRRRKV